MLIQNTPLCCGSNGNKQLEQSLQTEHDSARKSGTPLWGVQAPVCQAQYGLNY